MNTPGAEGSTTSALPADREQKDVKDRPQTHAQDHAAAEHQPGLDFVRRMIEEDNQTGKWGGRVATRFPPEPNGYLHIGHAKSIYLNFGVAGEYGGTCNLRYDDTNPAKEEQEYVRAIETDVTWLGFQWSGKFWASDYFDTMCAYAIELIEKGLAYVDDQTAEETRKGRGTLTGPGKASPFRDRPVAENIDLFDRMRKGEFPDGSKVLRAKIDMASPNLNLRDPIMYRILHESHHNTGDRWCIYPMYDWAHGLEDSIERITHSLCTLEFENHRPLYNWFIDAVNRGRAPTPTTLAEGLSLIKSWSGSLKGKDSDAYRLQKEDRVTKVAQGLGELGFQLLWEWKDESAVLQQSNAEPARHGPRTIDNTKIYLRQFREYVEGLTFQIWHPRQIEFARLNLTYTMLSKRKLLALVTENIVAGWDDPRMPTISGLRRRGYTPEAIRAFCKHIGLNKFNSAVEIGVLENFLRDDLNEKARRVMGVIRPLKVVITNYPEGQTEALEAINNPEDPSAGTRQVPFGRTFYIEHDDFAEVPPPKYYRLYPGNEVRLRYAYLIRCTGVEKDAAGNVTRILCIYDPATKGGNAPDGRKVKSTIHWVSAEHAADAEVRLYDHLFKTSDPEDVPEGQDWKANLNPSSLEVLPGAKVEPSVKGAGPGSTYQFERLGYFSVDKDSTDAKLVFNRAVSLKDTWAKEAGRKK